MANLLIQDTTLKAIADSIREKTRKTDSFLVKDLSEEITKIDPILPDCEQEFFGTGAELSETRYGITDVRLNQIANEVQRLGNIEDGLTPSQIVQKLQDIIDDDDFLEGTISHIHNETVIKIKPYLCYEDQTITSVDCPNVESIGAYSFYNCDSLTDVNLPKITEVPDHGFDECGKLTNVSMSSIKSIGNYGFNGCSSIKNASFSELESIGNYGFNHCTKLETLDAPKLKTVGSNGFYYCEQLKEINCPELETVGEWAFCSTQLVDLSLPKITYVPYASFVYVALENVDLPSVTSVGDQALSGPIKTINMPLCTSIGRDGLAGAEIEDFNCGTVDMPLLSRAGDWAFSGCKKLKTAYFPELTSAGQSAFENCTVLTKCEFEKKMSFGPNSFGGCPLLDTVILRADTMSTLYNVGYAAFKNTAISNGTGYIYVPAVLVDTYKANSYWSIYANQIRAIEDYPDVCEGKEVVREYVVDTSKEANYTFDNEHVDYTDSYALKTEYVYESTEKEIDSGRMISLVINTDDKASIEGLVIE